MFREYKQSVFTLLRKLKKEERYFVLRGNDALPSEDRMRLWIEAILERVPLPAVYFQGCVDGSYYPTCGSSLIHAIKAFSEDRVTAFGHTFSEHLPIAQNAFEDYTITCYFREYDSELPYTEAVGLFYS